MAMVALTTLVLLFALDPGGAIAESGFPDFRQMDLVQLVGWGFRTIGVVLAQVLIIAVWLWPKWRPPKASPWYSGTRRPGSMPAAAVSVLDGHMIWSPTLLASIIEMCQRGTLRIEAVGTRVGFLYRLSRQTPAQYEWERIICNSLLPGPTTVDALREWIDKRSDAIGDQIGGYLQQRGLFHDKPCAGKEGELRRRGPMGRIGRGLDGRWHRALGGSMAGPVVGERPDRSVRRPFVSGDGRADTDGHADANSGGVT